MMGVSIAMVVVAAASTAFSVSQAQQQRQMQENQAEFQAGMARRNAAIADQSAEMQEEEGRQARRDAYDAAQQKRRDTALMIGQQRATGGALGAQVDQGSSLDFALDTAEKGEIEAFKQQEAGLKAMNQAKIRGWQTRNQEEGQRLQGQFIDSQSKARSGMADTQMLGMAVNSIGKLTSAGMKAGAR